MNYHRLYDQLIRRGIERNWNRKTALQYVERHRIIPGCLGGKYSNDNIVFLTAREHYIAHWILYKIHKTHNLALAWFKMCKGSPNQQREYNSRHYDRVKAALSISQKGRIGTFKGKKHKPESIAKMKRIIKTTDHILKIRKTLCKLTDVQIQYLIEKKDWKRGEKAALSKEWECSIDTITRWVGKSFEHTKTMVNWIAFFSQTGSEIVALSKELGVKPALIVTNNIDQSKYQYHPELESLGTTIQKAKHNDIVTYFANNNPYHTDATVITLHGYLRIVPPELCNKYTMYNGHPGFITSYPELKGKDPQVRAWEGSYPIVGSVVHKVTPGVDEGEVVSSVCYTNRCESLDELFGLLKRSSLESWLWFMKGKV